MTKALYMMEIEEVLEDVSRVACRKEAVPEILEATKEAATAILISHYGLNPEDAVSQVAAACGEEP